MNKLSFQDDYDFEKANAELDQKIHDESSASASSASESKPAATYYDATKSFFDDISSDTKERSATNNAQTKYVFF